MFLLKNTIIQNGNNRIKDDAYPSPCPAFHFCKSEIRILVLDKLNFLRKMRTNGIEECKDHYRVHLHSSAWR
jgi:hypothetical protein